MAIKVLNGVGVVFDRINDVDSPIGGRINIDDRDISTDVKRPRIDMPTWPGRVYDGEPEIKTDKSSVKVESQYSSEASFSTLFNAFDLKADPVYNFYVADEATNDLEDIGDRRLRDVPRYIRISWQKAPDIAPKTQPAGSKRIRGNSLFNDNIVNMNRVQGLIFDGTRLEDFTMAKNLAANGYISPGSISTIVEMPMAKVSIDESVPSIDEQRYLMDDAFEGISIHELQKVLLTKESGLLASYELLQQAEAQELQTEREMFEGQFSILQKDGRLAMNSVTATSPAISMDVATPTKTTTTVSDFSSAAIATAVQRTDDTSAFTEVTFHDTSIVGLVSQDKVNLITRPEHVESICALGKFLPNLMMFSEFGDLARKDSFLPCIPSPIAEDRVEYIGYVIEKYEQDTTGMFRLVDEIEINDISYTEFIDTRIKYGVVYRYRIRSLLKWTRRRDSISKGWVDQYLSNFLLSHYSSYFYGDWGRKWAYGTVIDTLPPDPPDEFMVRTESFRRRAVLSWKLPANQQRDISHYLVWRKLKRDDIYIGDWELIGVLAGARNGLFFDNDVDFFDRNKTTYVYAAQTVSVHREFSMLSRQLGARFNQKFVDLGEHPLTFVSEEGVHLKTKGLFSSKPVKRTAEEHIGKDRISFSARTGIHAMPFADKTYTVRFESLDISREFDVELTLRYDNLPPLIVEKVQTVVIKPISAWPSSYRTAVSQPIAEGSYKEQKGSQAIESFRKVLASWDIASKK